jgi:hypothetical protein
MRKALGTVNMTNPETTITVTIPNHGLAAGYQLYLTFTSGGAPSGVYWSRQ